MEEDIKEYRIERPDGLDLVIYGHRILEEEEFNEHGDRHEVYFLPGKDKFLLVQEYKSSENNWTYWTLGDSLPELLDSELSSASSRELATALGIPPEISLG